MKKKWKITLVVCLAAAAVFTGVLVVQKMTKAHIAVKEPVLLYSGSLSPVEDFILLTAHRGLSGIAPENSIPAVELAGKSRFFALEFDIRLTKDDQWVVMHDENIRRMTNGKGKISDFSYDELLTFHLDNGAHIENYPNLKIPALGQMLEACIRADIVPMIEIKAEGTLSNAALNALFALLEAYKLTDSCILISFNHAVLQQLQERKPSVTYWYLLSVLDDTQLEICKATPDFRVAFDANHKSNTKQAIEKFAAAGLEFACWTVDDLALLEELYRTHGIKYFTSNRICPVYNAQS